MVLSFSVVVVVVGIEGLALSVQIEVYKTWRLALATKRGGLLVC